ncbi:hypothetical protein ACRPK1_08510 [Lactobacillus johnsonii]|uniref:hypothetical protein n=1 Tax=Lactobacillus johnsonii TaxID=33959 RepID=UPI003D76FE51
MKIKTFCDDSTDELDRKINNFIQHKNVVDIRLNTCTDDVYDTIFYIAVVMYDNKATTQLRRKSFELGSDDEVNSFIQNHDVIKVENFGTNSEEITTVLTYREIKE